MPAEPRHLPTQYATYGSCPEFFRVISKQKDTNTPFPNEPIRPMQMPAAIYPSDKVISAPCHA